MKRSVYLLLPLIALAITSPLAAQGVTSVGTEFVFSFPTNYEDPGASAHYVRLYIAATTRTTVRIYVGPTLKNAVSVEAASITTFDLTKFEAQALTRDTRADIPPDAIYRNKAVRVVADDPISLTGMNRTSYTTDGMLILPISALGNHYVVASARDYLTGGFFPDKLPSQFLVAAAFDSTMVTITTPFDTPNHRAGETHSITLDKGDVFSSMSFGPGGDLSGAVIAATKPVAVMAGQNCAYLPDQRYPACDHLAEMMLPVESWGKVYHAVPFATRLKGDLFRIFAAEPETEIYINGQLRFNLTQRGGAEGTGWAEYLPPDRMHLEFTSNKPIMVAQYNNSQNYDGVVSDPFYVVLTPVEQYQTRTIIATPKAGDFRENYMTIVSDSAGWSSMEIATTGTETWENLSQKLARPIRSFTSTVNGRRYVGVTSDIAPGSYKIRGLHPFAGYLYGSDSYDSYGYPMSVSAGWLGSADDEEPDIAAALGAGGRATGTATDGPDDAAVRTNLALVELRPEESSNYRLVVGPLDAGISRGATFELTPIDPTRPARAVVVASDKAGNVAYDTVIYEGPATAPIEYHAITVSIESMTPNPAGDASALVRYRAGGRAAEFTLTSTDGASVRSWTEPAGAVSTRIDLDGLAAGAYLVRLSAAGASSVRTLVVAR